MFGDSFFTAGLGVPTLYLRREMAKGHAVFVPMYGDSFFTAAKVVSNTRSEKVFVPMYGESSFTANGL